MQMTDRARIERLLRPRSVAVLGASPTPGSLGASVISNLDRQGFDGQIFLINPKRDRIGERPCLPSVDDLPAGVDVAVLAIPYAGVLDSMRALARRNIGAAVIFSAGFAEGGEAGLAAQRELSQLARDHQIIIEGPNCLGLVNYPGRVALTFVETPKQQLDGRGIGIISQSGAMAVVLSTMLQSRAIGISYSISTGNEAASTVEDYLDYLLDDPDTSIIALIVEQFRQAPRFLALAQRAQERSIPIVLLHPGRSSAARHSAATHTGAMAGDYAVMRAHTRAAGVLMAEDLQEFPDLLELLYRCGRAKQSGSVLLTESGAFKALALDTCEQVALALPALDDQNSPALRAVLPAFVPVSNPIDLTAQGLVDPDLYRRVLGALFADERFGAIVLGIIQTDEKTCSIKFPPIIKALSEASTNKTVVFTGLDEGAAVPAAFLADLRRLGVAYFPSPDRALRALAHLNAPHTPMGKSPLAPLRFVETLSSGTLSEYESKRLLAPFSLNFPPHHFVRDLAAAQRAREQLKGPVALKAQSRQLPHKSEAGALILNIKDADALQYGWQQLFENVRHYDPTIQLDGVLVEAMGAKGVELILGARRDAHWGATLLVGFGGVQAELIKDVSLIPGTAGREYIKREIDALKSSALLRGFRGSPALDVPAVTELLLRLGALLAGEPRLLEIDLNPVFVYPEGQGVMAVDALLLAAHE
jgi:acetate---CoA ligase (ADP-forming)